MPRVIYDDEPLAAKKMTVCISDDSEDEAEGEEADGEEADYDEYSKYWPHF